MNVFDLSHPFAENMPVFPGAEPPRIRDVAIVAVNGWAEKSLRLRSHSGTHLDAPAHLLPGGATLDRLPAGSFLGPGRVLDVSRVRRGSVEIADLEKDRARLAGAAFVLLYSGWAGRWGEASYFSGYPVLSEEAARWLAAFDLKGVGADMASFDAVDSTELAIHRILLAKGLILIENLTGLQPLLGRDFVFSCLPLNIAGGDGSPVRAVALL